MAEKKSPRSRAERGAEIAEHETVAGGAFQASPEAESAALRLRIVAALLWAVAIAGEVVAILWVLRQDPIKMWLLIVMIVVIGAFAVGGSLLWKKANRLDPASEKDKVRFFVQNQLGVIITVIAFLPLIVLIFLNKDLDGKQKGIAGGVAIVVAVLVGAASADWNPPSVEQYSVETNVVQQLTGENEVYYTKGGSVFHVCADVPDLRRSKQISAGTVEQAHADGKDRLTKKWVSEAINNCGIPAAKVDQVLGDVDDVTTTLDEDQFTTGADGKPAVNAEVERSAPAPASTPRATSSRTPSTGPAASSRPAA
ncbi:hypothetical protein [Gordonia neofelifaecis]|uniref:Uncharacterized protein n=1 Tax=Gordonia neofelifaecis NRRL B-59395 TaxID=644548 RepID=F1YHB3_9ACTN|nr:hypothetical protein [Gordonia neofelifaecis]EGD55751.1 hypothetical protein SCNU_05905 [Gordonia neofelifaecis NRRL B-59395]